MKFDVHLRIKSVGKTERNHTHKNSPHHKIYPLQHMLYMRHSESSTTLWSKIHGGDTHSTHMHANNITRFIERVRRSMLHTTYVNEATT